MPCRVCSRLCLSNEFSHFRQSKSARYWRLKELRGIRPLIKSPLHMHDTRHSTCSLLEVLSRARSPLRAYRYGLLHGLMASHVTSLPVSVGGAIRQRLPVQMSASEAKGSRAPRTQRDEGADPARRKAWNSSASRGMYHLHLTGAGEHSNRLGPTGRHDGVRSCTRNFLVAFWGHQPPPPPPAGHAGQPAPPPGVSARSTGFREVTRCGATRDTSADLVL